MATTTAIKAFLKIAGFWTISEIHFNARSTSTSPTIERAGPTEGTTDKMVRIAPTPPMFFAWFKSAIHPSLFCGI
jgi:hypothetical protein